MARPGLSRAVKAVVAVFAGLLAATPGQAEPGVLEVTVAGIRSDAGHVLVAVCDRQTFLHETCRYRGSAPSHRGSVVVRLTGLPPGTYAAQAYQDENDNRKIDRSLFGLPTEGIGFSNDAKMRFGPPSFGDAAFTLNSAGGAIQLTLRYY